jgi:hypothetical protein
LSLARGWPFARFAYQAGDEQRRRLWSQHGRSGEELPWIFCGNYSDPAISCRTGMEARWHRHFDKVRHQLLAFARRQILEPRNIDLNQSVTETLSLPEKVFSSNIVSVKRTPS